MSFTCKTLDEFLEEWGEELGQEANRAMNPLHVPGRDGVDWLLRLNRNPYPGQAHCIAAGVKTLNRQNSLGYIWEQGSGKTLGAAGLVHNHAAQAPVRRWHKKNPAAAPAPFTMRPAFAYRALVMCPGHLPRKWKREIENTLPGVKVTILQNFMDVAALRYRAPATGPEWFVIGKDRAKLSCEWKAGVIVKGLGINQECFCPTCNTKQVKATARGPVAFKLPHFEAERRNCTNCREPLWQDTPVPRDKYSPALFIKKHLKGFFQYLVVDESHDMKSPDSVQADAMGFMSSAVRKTITLTGTLVGGYAWHVRTTLFRVGAAGSLIDAGFGWKDESAFNEKYGRLETKTVSKSASDRRGNVRVGGSKSRTQTKRVRPGIMPTLFGDHLISNNIFLSLEEVCADMIPPEESVVPVPLNAAVEREYGRVEEAMRDAIAELWGKPGARGLMSKLLQTLLAYPDYPFDWKEIGYHDEEGEWHGIVTPKNFPESDTYHKEAAIISDIKAELAQGRKCWVYTTMVETHDAISRLEKLLHAEGIMAKTMRSSVKPEHREEWIDKEGPKNQVLLSHPDLVKTGLDFFDAIGRYNFPTIMFYFTGYNSFTLSQASRRAWRIGQKALCKIRYYFAKGTMQESCMTLMGKKMQATAAVSGRFSTEGLAAMAGDDDNMEMALARALLDNTGKDGEALRAWDKITSKPPAAPPAPEPPPEPARPIPTSRPLTPLPRPMPTPPTPPKPVPLEPDLFLLLDDPAAFSELPT